MQKETTKTNKKAKKVLSKKYGVPYARKNELRRGDIKLIQKVTKYAYISIIHQLDGTRAITPEVQLMADKLADNNKARLEAIGNININNL